MLSAFTTKLLKKSICGRLIKPSNLSNPSLSKFHQISSLNAPLRIQPLDLHNRHCFNTPALKILTLPTLTSSRSVYTSPNSGSNKDAKPSDSIRLKNEEIKGPYIFLIGEDGEKIGVKLLRKILRELDLDTYVLIQVGPPAENPVCKIFNRREMYLKEKQQRKAKSLSQVTVKEFKLSTNISEHDLLVKAKQARKVLGKGDIVRFHIGPPPRTRPKNLLVLATPFIEKLEEEVKDVSVQSQEPKLEQNVVTVAFRGVKAKKEKGNSNTDE